MNILIATMYHIFITPTIPKSSETLVTRNGQLMGFNTDIIGLLGMGQWSETILSRPRNKMARAITGKHTLSLQERVKFLVKSVSTSLNVRMWGSSFSSSHFFSFKTKVKYWIVSVLWPFGPLQCMIQDVTVVYYTLYYWP